MGCDQFWLFPGFALAFWMFAANYAALSLLPPAQEARHWFFVIRRHDRVGSRPLVAQAFRPASRPRQQP